MKQFFYKLLSAVIVLMLVFNTGVVTPAFAENDAVAEEQGYVNDTIQWFVYPNDNDNAYELVILGTGDMPDYKAYKNTPWAGYDLTKLEVKSGITTIGSYGFEGANDLHVIVLPRTLKKVKKNAFGEPYCSIEYEGTRDEWLIITIEDGNDALHYNKHWFDNGNDEDMADSVYGDISNNLEWEINSTDEGNILYINGGDDMPEYELDADDGMSTAPWAQYASRIHGINLDNYEGKTIGSYAFYGMTRIKEAVIPSDVETIGASAFDQCTKLSKFILTGDYIDIDYSGIGLASGTKVFTPCSNKTWASHVNDIREFDSTYDYNDHHELTYTREVTKENAYTDINMYEIDEIATCSQCKYRQEMIVSVNDVYYTGKAIQNYAFNYFIENDTWCYDAYGTIYLDAKEGKHFKTTYKNNKNVGTATVTLTFLGALGDYFKGPYTLNFEIKKADIASYVVVPAKTSYTYTGKAIKPGAKLAKYYGIDMNGKPIPTYSTFDASKDYSISYTNNTKIGTATVTIKAKGGNTKGSQKATFKIVPKGTSLKSLSKASKAFTAKWKKQTSQTTGYEIQYSTSKTFKSGNKKVKVTKNSTTSKKIIGLKAKKTYYVRIRTYKTVKKKNYYSSWSAKKSIKTK